MTPRPRSTLSRYFSPGFALPSAIFLLVVLGGLAAFLVHVSTHQQVASAADVEGIKAYQAARAGTEWGLFNFLRNGTCAAGPSTITPGGELSSYTVSVVCTSGQVTEGSPTAVTMAKITATACNQPDAVGCPNNSPGTFYIERQLSVVAGNPPP